MSKISISDPNIGKLLNEEEQEYLDELILKEYENSY